MKHKRLFHTTDQQLRSDRRPLRFWQPFNDWWREQLETLSRRPNASEIVHWYGKNAFSIWGDEAPTLQETRIHAKCLRSLPLVRDYFRSYRAKKKYVRVGPVSDLSTEVLRSQSSSDELENDAPASARSGGRAEVPGGSTGRVQVHGPPNAPASGSDEEINDQPRLLHKSQLSTTVHHQLLLAALAQHYGSNYPTSPPSLAMVVDVQQPAAANRCKHFECCEGDTVYMDKANKGCVELDYQGSPLVSSDNETVVELSSQSSDWAVMLPNLADLAYMPRSQLQTLVLTLYGELQDKIAQLAKRGMENVRLTEALREMDYDLRISLQKNVLLSQVVQICGAGYAEHKLQASAAQLAS